MVLKAHRSPQWRRLNTIGILLVIFVDSLGTALILPLLPNLLSVDLHSSLISQRNFSPSMLTFLYSIILTAYAAAMVIGAPLLGQLSDKIGRKPALIRAVLGTLIGYIICVLAIMLRSVELFILGRIITGAFAGSIPIAQARLIDAWHESIRSVSIIMFFVTAGFMLGPIIAGVVYKIAVLTGLSISLQLASPLIVAGALSMLSLLFTINLPTDTPAKPTQKAGLLRVITAALAGFSSRGPRAMLAAIFFFQIGWNLFYQYLPWLMVATSRSQDFIIITMTILGIGMCISFCYLATLLQKYVTKYQVLSTASILLGIFSLCLPFILAGKIPLFLLTQLLAALLYGCGYTSLVAAAVQRENTQHIGRLLGTIAAIAALTAMLTALGGGALANTGTIWIGTSSALCFFICFFISIKQK
ncbi:MFS transporter [Bartonella sp. DGB2]|uniref:MFS transporter n=1 Tax=Bartonella sp. DGB2 TaxID=3388426 RepID=UPI0039903176